CKWLINKYKFLRCSLDRDLYGTVAYIGSTRFQPGKWVGVVLDEPKGKNNGTVQGEEYFKCDENFGLFVKPTQLKLAINGDGSEKSSESMSSSIDEKSSSSSRLPQSNVKKMKLPLSKGDNQSKLKQPAGQKIGSRNSMTQSTDKIPSSTTTTNTRLPGFKSRTSVGDVAKSPSPEENNNDKKTTKDSDVAIKTDGRPSVGNIVAPRASISSSSTVPSSPGGSVAQQVARINQVKVDDSISGNEAGVVNSVQLKQLEQQNERLKEAVVKMRDLSAHERKEHQKAAKELEVLRLQVAELSKKNDKLTTELLQYEQQLSELTEQVDAALGSEEMVEQLTAKNLALEEKVQQLEESMEDFEQMRLMDEELQESNREMEKELKQELEEARFKMNELKAQLKKSQDQSSDYEQTILKFRQLTGKYQTQIQDMKDKLLIRDDENKMSTEMISSSENENMVSSGRYIFSQTKAWSEIVDNELRKLELENVLQHVRYLRSFLPDNYSKPGGDNDCVMLSLLFPRLSAKACLLISQLNDLYPHVPGGMKREHVVKSHKAEQWSFVYKITFYLNGLLTIFHKFDSVINKCSIERLAKLAQLQPELLAQERLIDFYFDLLKNSRLDENASLDNIDKIAIAWLKAEILRSRFYLTEDSTKIELTRFFDDLDTFIKESEGTLFRLKTIVPLDTKQKTLVFDGEVCDLFLDSCVQAEKCAKLLHEACKSASNQVSMMPVCLARFRFLIFIDIEGVESHSLEEMFQNACLTLSGKGGEKMNYDDFTKLAMGLLMNRLAKLIEIVDKNSYDTPVDKEKPHFPAILERAHARKLDSVEADGLRWQLDKKDNEVKDLKMALRSKAEEISEMRVRKEMAESRLHTTGKEGDERIVRLQRQVEEMAADHKKKEAENDKIMDSLQKEIEALEKENDDLKDRYKLLTKKSLLQGISAHGAFDALNKMSQAAASGPQVGSPGGAAPPDLAYLAQRLDELKSAYLRANAEKCRLLGDRMYEKMLNLPPLRVPKKSPAALSHDFDQSTTITMTHHHKRHDELSQLLRESAKFQKEYLHNVAVAKVIDITKKRSDSVCYKQTPSYAYFDYLESVKKLNEWLKGLQFRIHKQRKTKFHDIRDDNQPQNSFLVGRITFNENSDVKPEIVRISITPDQFRALHAKLAN
uniref:Dynactin subunit 1 n=1 Tax=Romanomermis culicivorax TaxID=13658 RepID=A0A915JGZ7_ROMCU